MRIPRAYPLTSLSALSLIPVVIYLHIFICVVVADGIGREPSHGLALQLRRPPQDRHKAAGLQPLLVRLELEAPNSPLNPRVLVDYRPVAWADFDAVMQKGLSRRPSNWPVYLEGAADLEWRWAAQTIDRIHGLRAQVYLLQSRTP